MIDCDTVVLTGDWIPDHELARSAGLDIDPGTQGPVVDTALRTSRPGVFAVGNLLHPVDTADIAALDGRHVADHVRAYLDVAGPLPRAYASRPMPRCAGSRSALCGLVIPCRRATAYCCGPTPLYVCRKSLPPRVEGSSAARRCRGPLPPGVYFVCRRAS